MTRPIAAMAEIPGVPLRVADHLTELIIRGEVAPGERVPEARITASLGVSRGSVREALQILAQRHLVELAPRRGAVVTEMTEQDIHDLYDVLIMLYTSLTQSVARRWRTPDEIAPLQELARQMQECAARGDELAVIGLSATFTEAGCELVGNPYLTQVLRDLRAVFNRSYYRLLASDRLEFDLICDFTGQVVELIRRRDMAGLRAAVQTYGDHQRSQVLKTF